MNLLSVLFCSLFSFQVLAEVETKRFSFQENGLLKVENSSGDITVTEGSTREVVVAIKKIEFGDHCELEIEKEGSHELSIEIEQGSDRFSKNCRVDLDITVPKKISQDIECGSGDVTIRGTEGDITLRVGSGDVAVQAAAKKVSVKTGSGDIDLNGKMEAVNLRSGSGKVTAAFSSLPKGQGFFDVRTGSGDVVLKLPKNSKIRTSFQSGSGRLKNHFAYSNDASFSVDVKTGSGDLLIKM